MQKATVLARSWLTFLLFVDNLNVVVSPFSPPRDQTRMLLIWIKENFRHNWHLVQAVDSKLPCESIKKELSRSQLQYST